MTSPREVQFWPPVGLYLALTFAFAWLLLGYWVVAMPAGGLVISPAFIVCAIVGGFAPSLAAIVASWRDAGRAAVGALLSTARRPVSLPYILLAIDLVPLATCLAWFAQARFAGP